MNIKIKNYYQALYFYLILEEAVQEVKRQAMLELQKAVSAAEQKATEMVSAERIKMERSMSDSRKKIREEVMAQFNHQEESSEVREFLLKF